MQSLVKSNEQRAILIASACAAALDAQGIESAWSGYDASEGLVGQRRTDTLLQYERPKSLFEAERYTRLFFYDPKITEVEKVDFGEEIPLEKHVIERFNEPIEKVAGIAYEDTIEHTFSKTTTLAEAFKVGAELAVKTYFKGSYAGIEGGAEVSAKLSAEYSRQWGSSETTTDTVSRHISLPAEFGGRVNYEAVRSLDKVQRKITAHSNLDYGIAFVSGPKPEPAHWKWESLEEFIEVAGGFAATTHDAYDAFIDRSLSEESISKIRDAGKQTVEFLIDYDNVQSMDIRIVDMLL